MKKTIFFLIVVLSFLIVKQILVFNVLSESFNFTSSSAEIIMETKSKRILHEKNINEKKYMASTTKILTAITIIEHCDLNEVVVVEKKTTGVEGSSIYLMQGEKLSVKDLLYGLMLRSGNDCAETLAYHCSGNIENFALLMNEMATKIGALNSNFVNPHGLHDENHYTTAYDLALISSYAIQNKVFKEIVSTKKITIPHTMQNYDRVLINKNKMLNEYAGSTGIKTGFTKKAGRCLVTSCEKDGLELVCVVLNCPPMFERSKELLNTSYNNFYFYKIIDCDEIIDFVETLDGKIPIFIQKDIVLPLTKKECENLRIEYNYPSYVSEKTNTEIGEIKIYCENNLIFIEKIYTII